MGTSYTALAGSGGMIATQSLPSSDGKPHESPLSGLNEGSLELSPRHVDLCHRLAVDLDPALGDETPCLARRADAEVSDEQGREVDRIPGRQRRFLDLFGCLVLADDTREVILCPSRGFIAMPPGDNPTSELELPLQ